MLDIVLEKLKAIFTSRLFPITLVFIVLFAILVGRIFTLQIVQGETHTEELTLKDVRTREIKSTRGNIYDKKGVLLAYNKLTYSVVLEESQELNSNEEKNNMLYELITILEKHGYQIENEFGLSIDENGELYFNVTGNAQKRFKKELYGHRYVSDLTKEEEAATAEEVYNYLKHGISRYSPMFNISDDYSLEDSLKIMTLRYAIYTNYPKYNQIIICSDVDEETVAAILENSAVLPGVEIKQQTSREYNESTYLAHIIGYTGLINAAELDALGKESEYNSSDTIGKSGIEKVYESELAGKKGLETITVNSSYKFVDVVERTDPVAGEDIYLTIDSQLQESIYHIIERNLAGILLAKINNSADAGTRGESTKDIKIPIYDVYYALINNNVIDTDAFSSEDATKLEKSVYTKFIDKREEVIKEITNILSFDNKKVNTELPEVMQDYMSYIYSDILVGKNILIASNVDKNDAKYIDYHNNKISFSEFLQYAIANNWVDLNLLDIGDDYYSTEELFEKFIGYIKGILIEDSTFTKKIYKDLVYSYKLSGYEICLLLFDQGVLKYNEEEISKLQNGTLSAYSFITNKIKNLEITPAQLALDPSSASVVVVDVKTGDVIAMVSYPSYDNNKFANRIDSDYYNKLYNDLTTPMINRTTKQRTAPGSTFKMLTSIAALEEGVLQPGETVYDELQFKKVSKDHGPKCWSTHSHGYVDVTGALEVSCNFFFYEMGWRLSQDSKGDYNSKLGLEKLAKYADILGLNRKTGIELDEYDPIVSDQDSIRSSIGQGTNSYTPVQIARYVTTVASKGKLYDLTLLDKIVDKDGDVILDNQANYETITEVKDSTWELVQEGMYKVANGEKSSSYETFKDFPVEVAGKTGTAQESVYHSNHSLFVSFAPYKNPEIEVTTVIPNGYASSYAVELTKDIYSYYFELEDEETLVNGQAELPNSNGSAFSE